MFSPGQPRYAGNEVRGLGNLLLVSHTVGTSGGVSKPQLHFEIRYRNKPVDPAGLLPR